METINHKTNIPRSGAARAQAMKDIVKDNERFTQERWPNPYTLFGMERQLRLFLTYGELI